VAADVPSGIEFQVDCDAGVALEIQRDTNSGFPSPVAVSAPKVAGSANVIRDPLPLNNVGYYYRARASRTGYQTTAWSATLGPVKPVALVDEPA
jgi:hypothetical protein